MSKRKILILATTLCMVAILAVGGTLAYFTDTDAAVNVFTVGNINIDLIEQFPKNELMPGLDVKKDVRVKNTGDNPAYVRVHIAIPQLLDSGSPEFAAYKNTLHFNFDSASTAEGQWSWNANKDGANYPENGGNWNFYTETIGGIVYNVYVVTYESILAPGVQTRTAAMDNVYLDVKVTQEDMKGILEQLGEIKILVAAEGVQSQTFEEFGAYEALNTAFGNPGAYKVNWTPINNEPTKAE